MYHFHDEARWLQAELKTLWWLEANITLPAADGAKYCASGT
jgi:hypothetical protein